MNYISVNQLTASEIEIYTKYSEVQLKRIYEPDTGLFIAESENVIVRALAAGYEPVSFFVEQSKAQKVSQLHMATDDLPVYVMDYLAMRSLLGYELTGGMLCAMKRKPLLPFQQSLSASSRIAVLCDVENPTNVGAIFRNAAGLGMDLVLLTEGCSDPLYRRAARVSMGTVFQIPWTFAGRTDWISVLQEAGYKVLAMALGVDAVRIGEADLKREERLAIVLGNEGYGLPEELAAKCDLKIEIPMAHQVDSLNVAAASAIAFWESRKIN